MSRKSGSDTESTRSTVRSGKRINFMRDTLWLKQVKPMVESAMAQDDPYLLFSPQIFVDNCLHYYGKTAARNRNKPRVTSAEHSTQGIISKLKTKLIMKTFKRPAHWGTPNPMHMSTFKFPMTRSDAECKQSLAEWRAVDPPLNKATVWELWLKGFHLPSETTKRLKIERKKRRQVRQEEVPTIKAEEWVRDMRKLLRRCMRRTDDESMTLLLLALQFLLGLRLSEIVCTPRTPTEDLKSYGVTIRPPREEHVASDAHWSSCTGFSKSRGETRVVERPCLDDRELLIQALQKIRNHVPQACIRKGDLGPCYDSDHASDRWASRLSDAVDKYCPDIDKAHDMRKIFAAITYEYFGKRDGKVRPPSMPNWTAKILGHASLDDQVLHYLGVNLVTDMSLDFGQGALDSAEAISLQHEKARLASLNKRRQAQPASGQSATKRAKMLPPRVPTTPSAKALVIP